ncbi:pyridoxal-phosphate dependent enzyme, partial [Paenibacillus sepulcri]|nr:pyridoxal-phosphate dependent enzyme [Paenibacillus sepulcri]
MMGRIVNSITELIGDTPAVCLQRLTQPEDAEVIVKLERFNPSGSVKDRAASSLILDAERRGKIQPGDTIIEPTS